MTICTPKTKTASTAALLPLHAPTGYREIAITLDGEGRGPALPSNSLGLAIECVRSGLELDPNQFREVMAAAKQLRVDAFAGNLAAQHIDDVVFWWHAYRPYITPQGRALVRASGHRTYQGQPACGVPQPVPRIAA